MRLAYDQTSGIHLTRRFSVVWEDRAWVSKSTDAKHKVLSAIFGRTW